MDQDLQDLLRASIDPELTRLLAGQ
jgi:hypothetical protein